MAQLQPQLNGWLHYNEAVKELTNSLNRQQQRLKCLHLATDVVSLSAQEVAETIVELKVSEVTAVSVPFQFFQYEAVSQYVEYKSNSFLLKLLIIVIHYYILDKNTNYSDAPL